jgi:hypothetical protein
MAKAGFEAIDLESRALMTVDVRTYPDEYVVVRP